eukprot:scaffold22610_cov115-Cylindrotheca_fusiformis.AAC.13
MKTHSLIAAIFCCSYSVVAFNAKPDTSRRNFLASTTTIATLTVLSPLKAPATDVGGKIKYGDESIMAPKAHGTSEAPVQSDLLYGVSEKLADKICNYNRHFAEMGGYFRSTNLEDVILASKEPVTFYDSVTGKPLFVAPINRSAEDFIQESEVHGWPSFRDEGPCPINASSVNFQRPFSYHLLILKRLSGKTFES